MESISHQEALQDVAYQEGTCYGCGPANPNNLGLLSYISEDGERLLGDFDPNDRFNAGIPNVAHGGLIATLIDCQSVWTAVTFTHLDENRPLSRELIWYFTAKLNAK